MKICDVPNCGKDAKGSVEIVPPYLDRYHRDLCDDHALQVRQLLGEKIFAMTLKI
jgi:hypothetical protein